MEYGDSDRIQWISFRRGNFLDVKGTNMRAASLRANQLARVKDYPGLC